MAHLSLIPEPKRGVGEHGENIRLVLIETAIARCLDLAAALSDGNDSVLAWFDRCEEANTVPSIPELREMIGKLYGEIEGLHFILSKARKPPSA